MNFSFALVRATFGFCLHAKDWRDKIRKNRGKMITGNYPGSWKVLISEKNQEIECIRCPFCLEASVLVRPRLFIKYIWGSKLSDLIDATGANQRLLQTEPEAIQSWEETREEREEEKEKRRECENDWSEIDIAD